MATVEALFSPDGAGLGARLVEELINPRWRSLSAAVAFVKLSGLKFIGQPLAHFCETNPGRVALTVGIDHGGSSIEAVALVVARGEAMATARHAEAARRQHQVEIAQLHERSRHRMLVAAVVIAALVVLVLWLIA